MALTKEQQREASRRILAKSPLTEEEGKAFRIRSRTPDEYEVHAEKRVCTECGAEFRDSFDTKGEVVVSMLEKFADHQKMHNPTPAQWAEAYKRIAASRETGT